LDRLLGPRPQFGDREGDEVASAAEYLEDAMRKSGSVRCRDCGFLALRAHGTMALGEAPRPYRQTGKVPLDPVRPQFELYERMPVCYENRRNFRKEIEDFQQVFGIDDHLAYTKWDIDPGIVNPYVAEHVIAKRITCRSFIEYRQGSSPEVHRQMLDRQRMLEFQAEREDADRRWRTREADAERRWRSQEGKYRRIELGILAVGVIVAIGAVIATVWVSGSGGSTTNNYYQVTPTPQPQASATIGP